MAYTEFYLTRGSSASDNNGGGLQLGANDGPIFTTASASYNGAGTLSVPSGGWGSTAVNDFICFDPTGTPYRFRVTALPGGNNLTVTSVDGLAPGVISTKTANVGGAFGTLGILNSARNTWVNGSSNPPRINVQSGTWSAQNVNISASNSGLQARYITVQGYTSSPGDLGVATFPANSYIIGVKDYWAFVDLNISCNSSAAPNSNGSCIDCVSGNYNYFERVTVSGNGIGILFGSRGTLIGCKAIAGYNGFYGIGPQAIGCVATGCTYGWQCNYAGSWFSCVSYGCYTHGWLLDYSASHILYNCVSANNTLNGTGAGIYIGANIVETPMIFNCVFIGNPTYGISSANSLMVSQNYNAFYNNTIGQTNNVITGPAGLNNISLSGDPFINAASGDFRINKNSAAGLQLAAAGYPSLINGQNTYVDIGALQMRKTSTDYGFIT